MMEYVSYVGQQLRDLTVLLDCQLADCHSLHLDGNLLEDLQGFPKLLQLVDLDLSFNKLSVNGLPELGFCTSLTQLNLSSNNLVSLEVLPFLPTLLSLNVSYNSLQCLRGLEDSVPFIISLNISGNRLEDISSITSYLPNCRYVKECLVSGNPIFSKQNSDFKSLFITCPFLESLGDGKSRDEVMHNGELATPHFDRAKAAVISHLMRSSSERKNQLINGTVNKPITDAKMNQLDTATNVVECHDAAETGFLASSIVKLTSMLSITTSTERRAINNSFGHWKTLTFLEKAQEMSRKQFEIDQQQTKHREQELLVSLRSLSAIHAESEIQSQLRYDALQEKYTAVEQKLAAVESERSSQAVNAEAAQRRTNDELSNLTMEKESLLSRCLDLQHALDAAKIEALKTAVDAQAMKSELIQSQGIVSAHIERAANSVIELDALNALLAIRDHTITISQAELHVQSSQISALVHELDSTKETLRLALTQCSGLQHELSSLVLLRGSSAASDSKLLTELAELKQSNESLLSEARLAMESRGKLEGKLVKLHDAFEILSSELEASKTEGDRITRSLQKSERTNKLMAEDVSKLQEHLEASRIKCAKYKAVSATLGNELAGLAGIQRELAQLRSNSSELESLVGNLRMENSTLQEKCRASIVTAENYQHTMVELQSERLRLQAAVEDLRAACSVKDRVMEDRATASAQHLREISSQLREMHSRYDDLESDCVRLDRKLHQATEDATYFKSNLTQREKLIDQQKRLITRLSESATPQLKKNTALTPVASPMGLAAPAVFDKEVQFAEDDAFAGLDLSESVEDLTILRHY